MRHSTLMAATLLGALTLPVAAFAQAQVSPGVATGATTGAVGGAIVGGPIGAVVGGVGGAVVGAIADDSRPRFREYVVTKRHPSYAYQSDVVVGGELPTAGVQYYEVPRDYGQTEYRYTIVNNRTVLVDPRTRRIVQIID